MRTVMKNKVFTRLMTALLLAVTVIMAAYPSVAYAQIDEKEAAQETLKEEPKKPEITVIKKEEEKEVRYPNKLNAKEPENLKQNNAASNGEKANTNKGVASTPSKARASVTENKDNANQDYPIHHNSDKENKETDKYSADARQFITFKTKNGKTFHLIINHDEQGENVMLLTEVSEDDLLNMVEAKEKPKEVVKEEPVKQEKTEEVKPEKKEEKSSTGTYILLALVTLGALVAGYYFKIAKKKEDKELEALEEDDDFFSEAEVNEEMENEEVENQETEDETDDSEDELEE